MIHEKIKAIIDGEEAIDHEFGQYLVGRIKDIRVEHAALIENIKTQEQQLQQVHIKRTNMEAIHDAYVQDLGKILSGEEVEGQEELPEIPDIADSDWGVKESGVSGGVI